MNEEELKKKEYDPFGMEWELEMLKFKKQELVEFLRGILKEKFKLESSLKEAVQNARMEQDIN